MTFEPPTVSEPQSAALFPSQGSLSPPRTKLVLEHPFWRHPPPLPSLCLSPAHKAIISPVKTFCHSILRRRFHRFQTSHPQGGKELEFSSCAEYCVNPTSCPESEIYAAF